MNTNQLLNLRRQAIEREDMSIEDKAEALQSLFADSALQTERVLARSRALRERLNKLQGL